MKKMLAMLVALLCCLTLPVLAEEDRTITVSGTATMVAEADIAKVSLGVISTEPEASKASKLNAALVEQLMTALKEAGVAEKDIATSHYYVNARRDYDHMAENGEYPIIGYEVSNQLTVTLRDVAQVGAVIDLALANGANSCDGITFASTKADEARDAALQGAVKEAQRRAELIATAAGCRVGKVLSVTVGNDQGTVYLKGNRAGGAFAEEATMDAGTQILSDGLSFSATVTMIFALEDAQAQ